MLRATVAANCVGQNRRNPGGLREVPTARLARRRDRVASHSGPAGRGVFATAFASGTDVLITDNLDDFAGGDSAIYDTSIIARPDGATRQLSCQIRRRPNGQTLMVAHPVDFAHWIERRFDISPQCIESTFKRQATSKKDAIEKK
ncbi:MAG: hypothetical protein WCA56_10815 [Xanthobacteraceae bacterium]